MEFQVNPLSVRGPRGEAEGRGRGAIGVKRGENGSEEQQQPGSAPAAGRGRGAAPSRHLTAFSSPQPREGPRTGPGPQKTPFSDKGHAKSSPGFGEEDGRGRGEDEHSFPYGLI